ncbi:MAG: helix-turn-helix transcriptional regulator [Anaerolineaceae bacterium]|nr:helix-turn-helix transcriptional regulator [Anaerolineaceae bacterium]
MSAYFDDLFTQKPHIDESGGANPVVASSETPTSEEMPEKWRKGSYNLNFQILYNLSFTPSLIARRSYLYLQTLGVFRAGPAYFTSRDELASYLMMFTYAGEGTLEYEGHTYSLKSGEGFFIDCQKPHKYYTAGENGWDFFFIHIDGFAMTDYYQQFHQDGSVKFSFEKTDKLLSILTELFQTQGEQQAFTEMITSSILSSLLTNLIVECINPDRIYLDVPQVVEDIREYINEHFAMPISLDVLSETFSISKYHLSRMFKKYIGLPPIDYLITIRINQAKELLKYSQHDIVTIGEMVGIHHANHFLYLFKKREGMTPSAFRKLWTNY